jgi:hypothetical protein
LANQPATNLCASSVFSVSLVVILLRIVNHRGTENTKVPQGN